MKIKFILPALTEAKSVFWRPLKYSLFPPLGLATLAGYANESDDVSIVDEHIENIHLDDTPDIVALEVYITSAYRAYEIADQYRKRGIYVVMGGLHVTSLPQEALSHANSIFLGPGEDTWPSFLKDYRQGKPRQIYQSTERTLAGRPAIRRDLLKRSLYLVPNSLVISRGCPHHCDFCYKNDFFKGGKSFYTDSLEAILSDITSLPGRHLFFLDDNVFANPQIANDLFNEMKGFHRIWQAATTVESLYDKPLVEKARRAGLRSLFIGFETLNQNNLKHQNKLHNLNYNYADAIGFLHDLGIMVNASFVFGMEEDDNDVFEKTAHWAIKQGIETATFHILTPYPGTTLFKRIKSQKHLLTEDWNLYDTRHCVFKHPTLAPAELEAGYWRAYKLFYKWRSIFESANKKPLDQWIRHVLYTGGWKKIEPLWDIIIKLKQLAHTVHLLENILDGHKDASTERKDTKTTLQKEAQSINNKLFHHHDQ